MKWLVEPEVFKEDGQRFVDTLKKLKVDHTVVEFGKPYDSYFVKCGSDYILHGSLQFAKAAKQLQPRFKVFCTLPKYECTYYYPRFGNYLFNSNYIMLPFGDLLRRKDYLFNTFYNSCLFIRPSSGNKDFTGLVLTKDAWDHEMKVLRLSMDPESLVVIAPPQEISREWRLVVVNNKVVASSLYKENEKITRSAGAPEKVLEYAETVLANVNYKPDPAWVLDVAEADDTKALAVLEVGSFSCCGFYHCDGEAIVKAIEELS